MQPPQGPYQQPDFSGYAPQTGDEQWTQRPLPGQMGGAYMPGQNPAGQQMPGQVPPPAQIAPDPAQMPVYPGQQGYGGQAPYPGQQAYPGQPAYPGQMPAGQGYGAAPGQNANPQPPFPPVGGMTGGAGNDQQGPRRNIYQVPKTGIPKAKKKKSKAGYVVLAALVLGFAAFAVLRMLAPGQSAYGYVRFGSLSARYTGDAVVVRSETVFSQDGVSQIDYDVDEGANVKRGTAVATIYTSGFSAKEWTTLQNYRNQIKEYHKTLISSAAADTKQLSLMTRVRERALEAQQLVQGARGSLSGQEKLLKEAMQDQQIYMKQKYPDDQKLGRLYDDENTQIQKISTWSKQFATTADGLVSFYTDGYEKALNMLTYGDYTPAQVRTMYNGNIPDTGETVSRNSVDIYRLVRQEPWVVLMLCNEQEWTPVTGRSYKLLIENFDNIIVDATVDSFTRSGGELLVRLMIDDLNALPNVLYIRSCRVQLGESVNTLMVPSRAIYIQNGRKGVVMATEGGQYWTGVEVVSDDGTVAYIIPDNAGVLYDGVAVRLF